MHEAQDQQDPADLGAQRFQHTLQVNRLLIRLEGQRDEAEVDQIKADKKEVINRIGEGLIPEEAIDEKNASVFVQRLRHPDGERNGDEKVGEISPNDGGHGFLGVDLLG